MKTLTGTNSGLLGNVYSDFFKTLHILYGIHNRQDEIKSLQTVDIKTVRGQV